MSLGAVWTGLYHVWPSALGNGNICLLTLQVNVFTRMCLQTGTWAFSTTPDTHTWFMQHCIENAAWTILMCQKLTRIQWHKITHIQHSDISSEISWWTYCSPGSGPPLVVSWWHIPAAVARMTTWILGISIGLVIDALSVVDRSAGRSSALLLCHRPLIWVTEGLVHRLVVVRADHVSGGSSHAARRWTLGRGRDKQGNINREKSMIRLAP